jgi:hypothetical protein
MDLDIYACDRNIYICEEKNFYFIFGIQEKFKKNKFKINSDVQP